MKKEHTPDGVTTLRGSRIVVCSRLRLLGSAYSLLCAVNRCEKDTQSFSLRLQVIRPTFCRERQRSSLLTEGGEVQIPLAAGDNQKEKADALHLPFPFGCGGGI